MSKMRSCNVVLAGVGGQGTVLLSRLIGSAAIAKGYDVRGTETIGMAQRGGSVVSHVRMGGEIHSPLVPPGKADLIIAFEPGEAVRAYPLLGEEGGLLVCDRPIQPVTSQLGGEAYDGGAMVNFLEERVKYLTVIDGRALIGSLPSPMTLNVALLGAAVARGLLPFTLEEAREALAQRVPKRYLEMNLMALETGAGLMP